MNLSDFVQQLFNDIWGTAQLLAPTAAVIGFLALGLLYMGNS